MPAEQTQTKCATEAFCKACKRPVGLPHECPKTGIKWVKINPNHHRGI